MAAAIPDDAATNISDVHSRDVAARLCRDNPDAKVVLLAHGVAVEVPARAAARGALLIDEHLRIGDKKAHPSHHAEPLGLPTFNVKVPEAVLPLLAQFLLHHDGRPAPLPPRPLPSSDLRALCPDPWDAEFVERVFAARLLQPLLLAANYLNLDDLTALCCAKVAVHIRGRSLEEVRAWFDAHMPASDAEHKQ